MHINGKYDAHSWPMWTADRDRCVSENVDELKVKKTTKTDDGRVYLLSMYEEILQEN